MAKISINIVVWNSMKYLPSLLASIREQTFQDYSILVIDNASTDGVVDFLRANYPEVTVIRNFNNIGFTGAHNQGIKYALSMWKDIPLEDHYVMVTNPDVILNSDFLEQMIKDADKFKDAAAFCGKLLRVTREGEGPLAEMVKSNIIDSTGLKIYRSRRVTDRGSGEEDNGQYDGDRSVFGVSGALALYRASSLETSRLGEEYFDNDFFAYKEDVDLSWRFKMFGFGIRYVPGAIAYHFRRAAGKEKAGFFEMIKNRRSKSKIINFFSYRNHALMILKNDYFRNLFLHLPFVLFYEIGKFFSTLFLEPWTFKAIPSYLGLVPKILAKRKSVMAKRKVSAKDMRKWFYKK